MKYTISAPASEPLTLSEAKAQLRIEASYTDDDALISMLIAAAREKFEAETGRALVERDVTVYYDEWPTDDTLALPIYPLAGTSWVRYTDEQGDTQTIDADDYTVDGVGQMPRIQLKPDILAPAVGKYPNAVQVLYVAGSSSVPASAKQSMLLALTMLYERREDMNLKDLAAGIRSMHWLAFNHRANLL